MRASFQITAGLATAAVLAAYPLVSAQQETNAARAMARHRHLNPAAATGTAATVANVDPQSAAAANAKLIPPGISAAEADALLAKLAALDGRLLPTREIVELLDQIMNLPASHMESALATLKGVQSPVLGAFLYSSLFARWGEIDPDAARAQLASLQGNPIARFSGTAALASGWLAKNPDEFVSFLTDKSKGSDPKLEEMRRMMTGSLFSGMNSLDPATAERLIKAAPVDQRSNLILEAARNNPDIDVTMAGVRAIEEARSPEQRADVHQRVARIIAERGDPAAAIEYSSGQTDPKDRKAGYSSALSTWMQEDKEAATAWIASQPPDIQAEAASGLRGRVSEMNAKELASFADTVDPSVQPQLWSMGLKSAAERDPADAVSFLPKVAPEDRPQSYQTVAESWTRKDPEAASGWIDQLPSGKEKDQAIVGMTNSIGSKEPDSATLWAATIQDPGTRAATTEKYATDWLKRDPEAAATWIQQSPALSPEQKLKFFPTSP